MKLRRRTELQQTFLDNALSHVGYRTRPGGVSDFGRRVGYSGHELPWDGAFIDCVAIDSGLVIPSCVHTPSGLAEFSFDGRLRSRPEPGDVVFFSFSTGTAWGTPHVGIVTDTSAWDDRDLLTVVEAQTDSGLARGSADRDGVYQRVRWRYEVLAFARPNFERRPGRGLKMQTDSLGVRARAVRPGKRNRDVQTVQLSLASVVGLRDYEPGLFDAATKRAYARWQRRLGYVGPDASGDPDPKSLTRLGDETKLFWVMPDEI